MSASNDGETRLAPQRLRHSALPNGASPREFIAPSGVVYFRTKLLRYDRARRFAKCLKANPRFCEATVEPSVKARGQACHFVQYRPHNPDRQYQQIDRQQEKRLQKALTEGRCYQWHLDTDGRRPFYWCLSTSGEVYEVTSGDCTCPDYEYRCTKVYSLRCKHILALEAAYERGELMRLAEVYDTPQWRAKHPYPTPVYAPAAEGAARP